MNSAITPHSAVSSAIETLLLTDHAASTRAVRSFGVCSSRYVASTGANTLLLTIRPNSATMTMPRPATPGRNATRPTTQQPRSAPNPRRTPR